MNWKPPPRRGGTAGTSSDSASGTSFPRRRRTGDLPPSGGSSRTGRASSSRCPCPGRTATPDTTSWVGRLSPKPTCDGHPLVAGVRGLLRRGPDGLPPVDDLGPCEHAEFAAGRADARQLHELAVRAVPGHLFGASPGLADRLCRRAMGRGGAGHDRARGPPVLDFAAAHAYGPLSRLLWSEWCSPPTRWQGSTFRWHSMKLRRITGSFLASTRSGSPRMYRAPRSIGCPTRCTSPSWTSLECPFQRPMGSRRRLRGVRRVTFLKQSDDHVPAFLERAFRKEKGQLPVKPGSHTVHATPRHGIGHVAARNGGSFGKALRHAPKATLATGCPQACPQRRWTTWPNHRDRPVGLRRVVTRFGTHAVANQGPRPRRAWSTLAV